MLPLGPAQGQTLFFQGQSKELASGTTPGFPARRGKRKVGEAGTGTVAQPGSQHVRSSWCLGAELSTTEGGGGGPAACDRRDVRDRTGLMAGKEGWARELAHQGTIPYSAPPSIWLPESSAAREKPRWREWSWGWGCHPCLGPAAPGRGCLEGEGTWWLGQQDGDLRDPMWGALQKGQALPV